MKVVSVPSICSASVMSGRHAGLHVLLKEHMPHGIYIHCSAHRLNLVINGTCQVVYYVLDYFSILSHIYSFFTESGVTNTYFKKAQQELSLSIYHNCIVKLSHFFLILKINLRH